MKRERERERHMRRRSEGRIKNVLLALLGIALLFMLVIAFFSISQLQQYHLDVEVESRLAGTQRLLEQLLASESDSLKTQLDFLKNDKQLQQYWHARDRSTLYRYAEPVFRDILSEYNVTHFYFIGLGGVCFLRVHEASRHEDQIDHFTMAGAGDKGETVSVIELGPLGIFTLRVVFPLENQRQAGWLYRAGQRNLSAQAGHFGYFRG